MTRKSIKRKPFRMVRLQEKTEADAVEALKSAALKLFAERGVDGVTVREIASAAGQKNHGAVGYHFGSKAELIRALVVDGARVIDERRNSGLDALESEGTAPKIDDVVRLLVFPSINLSGEGAPDCYNRFVVLFSMTHRDRFMEALDDRWNTGFQRCVGYIRTAMKHLTAREQTERIVFIEAYLGSVLASRETRLADKTRKHATWSTDEVLEHFAHTICAIVRAPSRYSEPSC